MIAELHRRLAAKIRSWRGSFGSDISTPEARRLAQRHFDWVDHGILRVWWWNFFKIADGAYRSNQPSGKRLRQYRDRGIKSVINLRGVSEYSHYLFESEACEQLGLSLTNLRTSAKSLPSKETILELETHFRTLEKPIVMHCKSGSDRAGFAAALYLMLIENAPVEVARRQMGLRYLHVRLSKAGVLDYFLECYRQDNLKTPISFRDWVISSYDREQITAEFASTRWFG